MGIRIDALPSAASAQPDHAIPAMRSGESVKLTAQQLATFIVALVTDSAPETLDTLNELAAALGDDPAFAATTAAALANRLRIDAAQSLTATQQDRGRANLAVLGRNLVINGQGRINQRAYVSATNTAGANQFTLDRWFVVTSGQNLSFTGDDSRRVMTAPAGGVSQVVEGSAIVGGNYVLNWTGTATATVNGTARTKGEVFTLTGNVNAIIRFTGGTFTDVQLELSTVATAYERMSYAQELVNCQRFAETTEAIFSGSVTSGQTYRAYAAFKVRKRGSADLVTFTLAGASGFDTSNPTIGVAGVDGLRLEKASTGTTAGGHFIYSMFVSAELTS